MLLGAIGKQLLKDILKTGTYTKVISIGRRMVEIEDSIPQDKLVQKVVDFDNLEASRDNFKGVDDVYCCIGTTLSEAGSAKNFVKIDQGYVLNSAKLVAEENRSRTSDSTPSSGANMKSILPYLRTKGETEEALKQTGFQKVSIFHPALLETVEPRPNIRLFERIVVPILSPISHFFNLHLSMSVKDIGKSMHRVGQDSSIKPSSPNGVSTSVVGSTIQVFVAADMETIVKDLPA
ncbi:hypothetical protein BDB01DRAFT_729783 [Pilobolus umbonatus]|nr:hypothetical protein BDB01DRAFT_729783 [Pilobolus umbonatus]